ncbi:MAG: FliM/FliN family flagellar motor C-terminal domain-containing protein [Proteobacteria bacterium]|nr:FliM/FliN family flagellar motor C-terminal domain-containing protein [Pseudomonadota bacterium]
MSGVDKVSVSVSVVLGSARFPLDVFLGFGRGARLPLGDADGERVIVCVGTLPIARGRLISVPEGRLTVKIEAILTDESVAPPLAA